MKVSKYVEDRIRTMFNNPHSTQGYPKTAQGNPCVLNDPSVTPGYPIVYGNSVQDGTPTPQNPVEIQSVGKKSINLINNFSAVPHEEAPNSLDGAVITDEYINVTRDSLFNLVNIPISLKANVAYTLWYELTVYDRPDDATGNSTVAVGVFEEGGFPNRTVDFTKNATIYRVDNYTFAEDTETYVKLWCNYGGVKAKVRAKIMLVEGTYSTDTMPAYEPYSGDKYLVPVKIKGKNLFNVSRVKNFYDSSINGLRKTSNGRIFYCSETLKEMADVQAGETYIMTAKHSHPDAGGQFIWLSGSSRGWYWGNPITLTQADLDGKVNFYKCAGDANPVANEEATITEIQIEKGEAPTEYEQYFNEIVNLYLDEPLRKAAGYADYIDWEKGVVKKIIETYKISDSSKWTDWKTNGNRIQLYLPGLKKTEGDTLGLFTAGETVQNLYDDEGSQRTKSNKIYALENIATVFWYPDYTAMGLDGTEDKTVANEKLQEWLKTIPLKQFEYVKLNPTETPIDLPKLPVVPHRANIVSVDTEIKGDLKVKYHSFTKEEQNV